MSTEKSGCLFVVFHLLGLLPKYETNSAFKAAVVNAEVAEPGADLELVELPYRICDNFLSPAEQNFYVALKTSLADRAVICPKVRLGDILSAPGNEWKHKNRINQKHIDFLVCSCDSMRPLVAIELDDSSHERASVRENDQFKDAAFAAAGLPLVRFKTKRTYDARDVAGILVPYIDVAVAPGVIPYASVATNSLPTCPKCGVEMVQRTATRGQQAGKPFFGCPNFPRCRETAAMS